MDADEQGVRYEIVLRWKGETRKSAITLDEDQAFLEPGDGLILGGRTWILTEEKQEGLPLFEGIAVPEIEGSDVE